MESNFIEIINGFSVKSDTVFSVSTSIFVFISGIIVNEALKAFGRYRKRKFNRTLVKLNLPLLIEKLEKQKIEFETFVKHLYVDNMESIPYTAINNPHIQIIYEIGYSELHKAYFSGIENLRSSNNQIKVDSYGKLWSRVNHLQMSYNKNKDEAISAIERIRILQDERNTAARTPKVQIEKFLYSLIGKEVSMEYKGFIVNLQHMTNSFFLNGGIQTPTSVNKFLLSINQYIVQNLGIVLKRYDLLDLSGLQDNIEWAVYKYGNEKKIVESTNSTFQNKINTLSDNIKDLRYANNHLK